jgi:PAS domain S-box-containing protein
LALGYGLVLALLLVVHVARLNPGAALFSPTLLLLLALLLVAPLSAFTLAPRSSRQRLLALGLLVATYGLALALVLASGGYASPFWLAVALPMISALLLLPQSRGVLLALAMWGGYGLFALLAPGESQPTAVTTWLLQSAAVGLFLLVLERVMSGQQALQMRSRTREKALQQFLLVSNRMRVTTRVQTVLEDVAGAVQAAGDFDCVTLCQNDWETGQTRVAVAIGASGRRLTAVEKVPLLWETFSNLLETGQAVGAQGVLAERLPFRTLPDECHLLLPLVSQLNETTGVLTVSAARDGRPALLEALPLLELLANQAAAALDNATLYSTLEERVQQATAELAASADDLRRARDRAEVLYHIARALSVSLDEQQVLEQTLALVAQSTGAERGGIMLLDGDSGRLSYRTSLGTTAASPGKGLARDEGLAGWVLANKETVIVPDTTRDERWQFRSVYDIQARSALTVPVLLDQESLGVLVLIHSGVNHFTDDHAQIALAAAGQAAVALSKAKLYHHISTQSDWLEALVQQREEEASKLMAILSSIGDGVVVGDRQGRIRIINPAAEEILGITGALFLERPLASLPGAPQAETHTGEQLQKITLGERTVRAHAAPVVTSRGEALGNVVVYHDMTREEAADRLKSELVATASHELRTPMTSIRGYVDMLLLETFGPLSDQQRDFLRVIKNNVVRLVQLIDELLDMSRAESGEVRLRREPVNMAELLRDTSQSLYNQFSERQIDLYLDLQDNLPPIQGDQQRLQQIAVNLLGNACKYTPPGGQVEVKLRNGGHTLRVDVRDSGVGISETAQPYIFTPFYRADNPLRDQVSGTGLGLSITRKLVELHGGRIWFESTEGQGSTFSFTLPVESRELSIES